MDGLSSTISRVSSAISGLSNAFLGQTRSRARLNAIASYDQSNELFKVRFKEDRIITLLMLCTLGIPQQGNDVLVRVVERC